MSEDWFPGAVRNPQPGGGGYNTGLPPRVVWHITWDALGPGGARPSFGAVSGYLQSKEYCSTLMWDPFTGYVEQFYPASQSARALVAWNEDGAVNIQVEALFSPGCVVDGVTYATLADTPCVGLGELLDWMDGFGIPRIWPMGAPQWAGNSRDVGIWNSDAGHYGHCNVPDNTHTDPGPMPDLNQDDDLTLTPEQAAQLAYIAGPQFKADIFTGASTLEQDARHAFHSEALHTEVEWMGFDGKPQPPGQRHTTSPALALGWSDAIATSLGQLINNIPTGTLKQGIKLNDGTVTDLASILAAILAKPATVTNVTGSAIDIDSLVARLKAELPPAICADLAAKLTN